ncbi:MAG: T9SS type A sorting domain-containing protein [Flavobacteriaceae bacterium]|nr:T9SS type A sorting domain-containing protein [Flavobacteriaceae bacterium]
MINFRHITLVVFLFIIETNAQSVYNFETENLTYQDLTGSISLNNGEYWDDPEFIIPFGFDFQISSFLFDTIYVIEFGPGGILSSSNNDTGILPIFAPITQDIESREDVKGNSTSPISYKVEGVAGSQILKIEWKNFGFYGDTTENDFMNMQVWLYEGTNVIEYRYGESDINNPNESFEGGTGPVVILFTSFNIDTGVFVDNGYMLHGNPEDPSVLVYEAGSEPGELAALEGIIPNGTVYRFTPEELSIEDYQEIEFNIFPNPVSSYLFFQTNITEYKVSVYNNLGQEMYVQNNQENSINVSNLSSGLYIVKFETEKGFVNKKFIKKE